MNDFLTEKNKKTGVLGKLKWVLCGFCILFTLGAIGAAEKYIGEGCWGMAATEIILGLLFLYPTFREIQKALKKKKAREIACWFESYAQSTLSFEKFETEMGKDAVRKLEKMIAKGYIRNIQIDREENYILITAPNRRVNEKIYITVKIEILCFLSSRYVSLAINISLGIIRSTTGWRPSLISMIPFSLILGRV